MLVGVAPTRWWSGTTSLFPKLGLTLEADFKPILNLLSKKFASATLVQCLIERWWDTTHIFHITEQEMTVIPYDFHCMVGLSFEGSIINLDGVSGI